MITTVPSTAKSISGRHRPHMMRWLFAVVCLSCLSVNQGQTALRVATCTDGRLPYVNYNADTGAVSGFEVDLWNLVYGRLTEVVAQDWPQLLHLVPGRQPAYVLMSMEDVEESLENSTVDVGFCALAHQPEPGENDERYQSEFDFLPVHLHSGYQAVIKSADESKVDFMDLLSDIFSSFQDAYAQTALLMLLYFAIIFAHIFWMLEGRDNGMFEDNYGPGIIDAIWFSLVTALTVGYGDKVTTSLMGKIVALIWMVLGAYILGIFTAALTSAFVVNKLAGEEEVSINAVKDLAIYAVGTASEYAVVTLVSLAPGISVRNYPDEAALLQAVVDGGVQVAVLDSRVATVVTSSEEDYAGALLGVGPVFHTTGVAMATSRVGGAGQHPIHQPLRHVMVELLAGSRRAELQNLTDFYFDAAALSSHSSSSLGRLERSLKSSNLVATVVLGGVAVLWSLAVGVHYRREIQEELVRARFLKALGLGKKHTLHQLRLGAQRLFDRHDRDGSGALDMEEIMQLLRSIGKEVSLQDVRKYIEREKEESKLEAQGLVTQASNANLMTQPPTPDNARAKGTENHNSVTKEEFVGVIEGIVLDQEEEEDEIQDLRQPAQQRHIVTFVGDIQAEVQAVQDKVDASVGELRQTIAALNHRLDTLLTVVAEKQPKSG